MTYLASQAITESYYLSGIVSREFETPTGAQMSDGLRLLNELLVDRTIDNGTIPYTQQLLMNAVQGQSAYYIPNMINLEVFTFYIKSVRYQTRNQQRQEYFGSFRVVDIESLPFDWHFERSLNGGTLYLYFVPDMAYPLEIWGTFRLSTVTEFQDLSLTIEQFYINFLMYLLAERLCIFNSFIVPNDVKTQLGKYYQWINKSTNVMDLRMNKLSSLSNGTAINYALVNLSNGWVPV
jgi:hypothetical protein